MVILVVCFRYNSKPIIYLDAESKKLDLAAIQKIHSHFASSERFGLVLVQKQQKRATEREKVTLERGGFSFRMLIRPQGAFFKYQARSLKYNVETGMRYEDKKRIFIFSLTLSLCTRN